MLKYLMMLLPQHQTRYAIDVHSAVQKNCVFAAVVLMLLMACQTTTAGHRPDFDRDGVTDLVVWRPSNGTWYVSTSSGNAPVGPSWTSIPGGYTTQWGLPGDRAFIADFDGDCATDLAVVRSPAMLWYLKCSNGVTLTVQFGLPRDVFAFGDCFPDRITALDKVDGRDDMFCYRSANRGLYFRRSSDAVVSGPNPLPWPLPNIHSVVPLSQFVDATHRQERRAVAIHYSNPMPRLKVSGDMFGSNHPVLMDFEAPLNGIVLVGDYNGDKYSEVAVFDPVTAVWTIGNSNLQPTITVRLGEPGDIPLVGDFDGDGKDDLAVCNPRTMVVSVAGSGYYSGHIPKGANWYYWGWNVYRKQWGIQNDVIP
ncbi:MAG: VCBS repeat-containing protein [Planctomyces sp.]|nr:VCBS repeat-containing protein [Planctomyces sp.]